MKKFLLLNLALIVSSSLTAQVLETDTYSSYTVGNIGTSTTGTVAGQGGMYPYTGAVTDYQIVSGTGGHGNYLQVTTGNTATATASRYVFKDGLDVAWNTRTAGNNIIKGVADIYTGTSTGVHSSGVAIYGEDADGNSVGIVGIRYNSSTKTINGLAYLTDGLTGNFYNITGLTTSTFPANTWVSVGYSYDTITGQITYVINNGTPLVLNVNGYSTPAGFIPNEFDVYSSPGTGNNATTTFGIDNYRVLASNTSAILAIDETTVAKNEGISIYPNPVVDYLTIKSDKKVNKVEVFDMSGRNVNAELNGEKVNVTDLSSGNYIINIETKEGKTSKKFIKK
ncbi:hypothetical protein ASG22_13520 [Chryseobacterium sp. Leaf405]|uniref:T9SS type A sorting domain-containing protein n=1 Tax=Chryseobacterium sp. Leaf405 TaxID=1736367 RepID=UPI0006F3ADF1|nr:T9SS type A sorting domain-containing protein [Chryseobacterium sp. Leaf405]KQT23387.1 hypothetical protein ASG22_13520 [Chryseobacterium sp. Leaf405]